MPRQRADGTQCLERAVDLLRTLGTRRRIGWRITDLSLHCNMNDSTVHRIMSCLSKAGLAQQRRHDRRYVIGPLCFELALTLPPYFAFQNECQKYLTRVARKTGWSASAFLRSGDETVCIQRVSARPKQSMIEVGMRRPLAGSAFGIAILLAMPYRERLKIMAANRKALQSFQADQQRDYAGMWKASRALGAGLNLNHVVKGIASVGMPLRDSNGLPFGSLGVTGPHESFTRARIGNAVQLLAAEADLIQAEQAQLIAEMQHLA